MLEVRDNLRFVIPKYASFWGLLKLLQALSLSTNNVDKNTIKKLSLNHNLIIGSD